MYRVYYAEDMADAADIIVGDGTRKDWIADLQTVAPVYYNAADLAKRHGKIHIGRFSNGALDKLVVKKVAQVAKRVNKRKALVA